MTDEIEVKSTKATKRRPLAITAVVVVVGVFGWLLYGGLDKNVVFFLTPQELLAKGTDGYDVPVRLGGQVKPGTVKWDDKTLRLTFDVTDGTSDIAVQSSGAPPQMFRDGQGVVVEGRFGRDHVFNSTGLMIKHSNEYRPPKPGEKPQEMYKTLIKGSGA
jgi:cytochrome c-type biogenesis protein CcmE